MLTGFEKDDVSNNEKSPEYSVDSPSMSPSSSDAIVDDMLALVTKGGTGCADRIGECIAIGRDKERGGDIDSDMGVSNMPADPSSTAWVCDGVEVRGMLGARACAGMPTKLPAEEIGTERSSQCMAEGPGMLGVGPDR
jgi:hypothetical protein